MNATVSVPKKNFLKVPKKKRKKKHINTSNEKSLHAAEEKSLDAPEENNERKYCKVCNVHCTSYKNLRTHQQGRKHLNKLSDRTPGIPDKKKKSKSLVINFHLPDKEKSSKDDLHNQSHETTCVNSNKPEEKPVTSHSESNMSQNYNRIQSGYLNSRPYYPSRSRQSFPNNRHFFNEGPLWSNRQNPRFQSFPTSNVSNNYEYSHASNFFPNEFSYDQNHYDHQVRNRYSFSRTSWSDSHLVVPTTSRAEAFESGNNSSNFANNTVIPNTYRRGDKTSDSRMVDTGASTCDNEKQNYTNDKSNCSSNIGDEVCREASRTLKKISHQNQTVQKIPMHSRLFSSTENASHNEKKKGENQSIEFDKSADKERIKNYMNNLLEINPGQISRLIHPSTHKDKAAVNHLMTNLSKSKKKENLSKLKIRSNSMCSSGTNDDDNEENKALEHEAEKLNSKDIPSSNDKVKGKNDFQRSIFGKLASAENPTTNEVTYTSSQGKILEKCLLLQKESLAKEGSHRGVKKPTKRKNSSPDNRTKKQYLTGGAATCETEKQLCADMTDPEQVSESQGMLDLEKELPLTEEDKPSQSSHLICSMDNQQLLESSGELSVNGLVKLFASGNVTAVKDENDPVIDALQNIDHDVLMKACSSQSIFENPLISKSCPTTAQAGSAPEVQPDKNNRKSLSPVVFSSNSMNHNVPVTITRQHSGNSVSNVTSVSSGDQTLSSLCTNTTDEGTSFYVNGIDFMPKDKSDTPEHLRKLVSELKDVSCQEEAIMQSLEESNTKISEYQQLVEEWKDKKERLQKLEESLRKRRIEMIELLQNAVKATEQSKQQIAVVASSDISHPKTSGNLESHKNTSQASVLEKNLSTNHLGVVQTEKTAPQLDSDEVQIIPIKAEQPEVIVIDDEPDENALSGSKSLCERSRSNSSQNVPKLFDIKHLEAHETVVNCLLVFEDHLYTCSNDNTGKRFNLKNPLETVTYHHSAKNVTEIVVEKIQSEALVLTCSNRMISLFIASNGTKIKTYIQHCGIMSICKGWGKFYTGLADGIINVYNWKYEEKELVKSEYPVSRIAATDQGRLHILIVLTSNGNISVRDAETGLLIRYIKGFVKLPSWMTVCSDVVYLSSSDKTLTILDILTGRAEKKLYVSSHTTGLAAYKDYIFTISYSGLVNCYNKEKMSEKKLYYGAGKNGLTCIYVFEDWVFTGNRKGDISLFKFDPNTSIACQFGQCCYTFGLWEDLHFHVGQDHVLRRKNLVKCCWGICNYSFPSNWSTEEKVQHVKKHLK